MAERTKEGKILTPFNRIKNGEFLALIQRAGIPLEKWGEFLPELVPVNFLFPNAMVDPDHPTKVDHDRIRWYIDRLLPKWTGDMLLIDLEQLPEANGITNQIRGRTSQCLDRPTEWTEECLQDTFVAAKAEVHRTADILSTVTATVRECCDMKLAHYATCPNCDCRDAYSVIANRVGECIPHHAEPQQWFYQAYLWLSEHMLLQSELMAPLQDWYAPSLYLVGYHGYLAHTSHHIGSFVDDATKGLTPMHMAVRDERDIWNLSTLVGLQLARSIFPSKPMIPFLAVQWWQPGNQSWSHGYGTELVDPNFMEDMLDFVRPLSDSVVIWCQHKNIDLDPNVLYKSETFKRIQYWARRRRSNAAK